MPKDPEVRILHDDTQVEVTQVKKKKKLDYGHATGATQGEEDEDEVVPKEVIRAADSSVVI